MYSNQTPLKLIVVGLLTVIMAGTIQAEEDLLAGLKPEHPRLLVKESTWNELKTRRGQDPVLNRFLEKLESDGVATLTLPSPRYQKEGKRLLSVSRTALQHIVLWSFDYRITGDPRFLQRAEQEMLAVSAFPDWNPSHFLDVAEMSAGVALGYDWLYDALPVDARQTISQAIVAKALRPGTDAQSNSWYEVKNNWNSVCSSGMTLGALAVAEDEPELSRRILRQAKDHIHNGLESYAPDGVYPEGPTYWGYGTDYQVLMLAALESALGTDWGLSQSPGFLASANYENQMTGPTKLLFNFSDGSATNEDQLNAGLFWMAQKLQRPDLLYFQRGYLEELESAPLPSRCRFLPLIAFWWPAKNWTGPPELPRNWLGQGQNPLAVFRSSWSDSNALYLAVKGGSASHSHAHMDAGSFILDLDGVRWAEDLGKQEYDSLESKGINLWGMNQDSSRWKVFRLNNFSHNTLTINGQLHDVKGFVPLIQFSADTEKPHVTADLSQIFAGQATRVTREFQVRSNREAWIQDDLEGLKPSDTVRWAMVTGAAINLKGNKAVLMENGKKLEASITTPPTALFNIISAEHFDDSYDAPNPNTRILIINTLAPESGKVRLGVRLRSVTEP